VASTRARTARLAIVSTVAAVLALTLMPQSGQAAPQATLDQVKAQLASLDQQAEVAQENLNSTRVKLAAGNRALAQINARVARSQAVVDAAQLQVGRLASAAYRNGGFDETLQLLLADNPTQFLEQMSALDSVSRHQSDTLRTAAVAQQRLAQDKLAAKQQQAALAKLYQAAKAEYAAVDAAQAKVQALFNSLSAAQQAAIRAQQAAQQAAARRAASAHRSSRGGGHGGGGPYDSSIGGRVVAYAMSKVGDSYVWGASGPNSFDCSGLTMRSYSQVGISLPHSSSAQYGSGRHISRSNLEPGDLVFFYSPIHHVGIYIGGGMIVHAANPGEGVTTAPLSSMPYVGAVRPY
jgi:cell wall-associated NlpC family hydrolase